MRLLAKLNEGLYEKEKPMRMALLATLAGESVFLLGPPGVAKSMIARRLKYIFREARAFEYLMGKFSTPDEVFGPVSISKLKNEDKYERITARYLPGANIVFLDEIWKASPPIQNALLTVLNEKIFRNGEQEFRVDLRGLISASNELPLKGEGLEALWDRFLIRMVLGNIEEDSAFEEMLVSRASNDLSQSIPETDRLSDAEYAEWQAGMAAVAVPPHVLGLLSSLRRTLRTRNATADDKLYVSDRRWRKIANLLRACAYLHDRQEVQIVDCFLIADCIWDRESQAEEAVALVLGAIAGQGYRRLVRLGPLKAELETLQHEIKQGTQTVRHETVTVCKPYRDKFDTEFCLLQNFWGDTSVFIRQSDLDKLRVGQDAVFIPVFEQTGNTFRPFQTYAFTRKDEFTLENKGRTLPVETETEERETMLPRLPSAETVKIWNSQIQLLLSQCDQFLHRVEERRTLDAGALDGHLFVPDELARQSLESLRHLAADLMSLRVEIQKTRHLYDAESQN